MIWGDKNTALGKELTYGTEKLVTDFTIRFLPDVSHWVQQEAPEAVNEMIEARIAGKEVPKAGSEWSCPFANLKWLLFVKKYIRSCNRKNVFQSFLAITH